ncbi:unnamed protein product, partial [Closterium sp. NIES-54]
MHPLHLTSIMSSLSTSPLTSSSKSNTFFPHPPPPLRPPPSPLRLHPRPHLKPLPPPILLSILLLKPAGPTLPTPHLCMAIELPQLSCNDPMYANAINESSFQYSVSSSSQPLEFILDSGATHTVLRDAGTLLPLSTPSIIYGADSSLAIQS